jgi:hypothetical protein
VAISGTHTWVVAQSARFATRKMVTAAISRWIGEKTG